MKTNSSLNVFLKNVFLTIFLILLYALPHSTYYIDAKALLLLVLLFCLIKYLGPESFIYYISILFLGYDIINSELYTHNNSFWFLRSLLPQIVLSIFRGVLFFSILLICLYLLVFSWVRIFQSTKGRRGLQIGLVGALIFPSLVSIIFYPPIDLISFFVIFLFGVTLLFSALLKGYSTDIFVKFLQGPFLIMILIITPLRWYRVNLFWGIAFGGILVIILVVLPLLTRRASSKRQALIIFIFEGMVVLGLSIYQLIMTPLPFITMPAFLQFFTLQGLLIVNFHPKVSGLDHKEGNAILP